MVLRLESVSASPEGLVKSQVPERHSQSFCFRRDSTVSMSDQFPDEADADADVAGLRNHTLRTAALGNPKQDGCCGFAGSQLHTCAALWANELPEAGWEAN